jgi:hypothetical protein
MRFLPIILSIAFLLVVATAASMLLQACGIRVPFTSHIISICDDGRSQRTAARLATLEEERNALRRDVAQIERALAITQCEAARTHREQDQLDQFPLPKPEPEPDQASQPDLPSNPQGLDRETFENRDIAVLEGCWDLDSSYSGRNIATGQITDYNRWRMCFDASGRGTQTMQGTDGSTCQGPAEGRFDDQGRLIIDDGAPLPCSDGFQFFRRVITCQLDGTGRADCMSEQPFDARGGSTPVGLRRARER